MIFYNDFSSRSLNVSSSIITNKIKIIILNVNYYLYLRDYTLHLNIDNVDGGV